MSDPVKYHSGMFPPKVLNWERLIPFIGPASAAVARYDGTLAAITNPSVLLSPLTTQEAVLSSRIEGTVATMGEVLEFEAEDGPESLPPNRREDIFEILNYRQALSQAEDLLTDLPLCMRVIRETHATLLRGVRGENKAPGEIRAIPNWIGSRNCPIEEAKFIPIEANFLPDALSKWERFANNPGPDRLVQLAILHAEFEALHPFLDGNGRLGRMLVPLYLWQEGLIRKPMFYVSAFLESNREEYYERLLAVSRDGDWTEWCRFFLLAVETQANENQRKAAEILSLYEYLKPLFVEFTHSQYAIHALDWIFGRPIFRMPDLVDGADIPGPTARRIINAVKNQGIIRELRPSSGRKAAVLAFPGLLNIAEGRELF